MNYLGLLLHSWFDKLTTNGGVNQPFFRETLIDSVLWFLLKQKRFLSRHWIPACAGMTNQSALPWMHTPRQRVNLSL